MEKESNDDLNTSNNPESPIPMQIESLNETMKPVEAAAEEKEFIESKKSLLDIQQADEEAKKENENKKASEEQKGEPSPESMAAFGSLFALPKLIEIPLLKARLDYDWDMQDEQLSQAGIAAMSAKYGADGKLMPPEAIYGISIALPPIKGYVINKIKGFLDKQKSKKQPPARVEAPTIPSQSTIETQMDSALTKGMGG